MKCTSGFASREGCCVVLACGSLLVWRWTPLNALYT